MEMILTQDVDNLGLAGQVVNVAKGYARNYLAPAQLALPATPGNLKMMAKKRAEYEHRSLKEKERALETKAKIDELTLVIIRKVGEKSKLYGSVTTMDIVEAASQAGFECDRKKVRLAQPLRALGDYQIPYRLHPDVPATLKVVVKAEAGAEPVAEAAKSE